MDLMGLSFVDDALSNCINCIRGPHQVRTFPRVVIFHCPFFGGVKRLVRVELVDEEHEAFVLRAMLGRCISYPLGCGTHCSRPGEVFGAVEVTAGIVVMGVASPK